MGIRFLHPRTSASFKADVDPNTTGETCIHGLIEAGFIEAAPPDQPYALALTRTNGQVPLAMTMQDAGVREGDVLVVVQPEVGA